MTTLHPRLAQLFQTCRDNPECLEEKHPEMKKVLDACCGKGQGLGNKASDQEACFAVLLEKMGWTRGQGSSDYSYLYQAQGTQKAIDFQLSYPDGLLNLDLKHSEKDSIFLNDGTFLDGVVYIISFTRLLTRVKGQRSCPRQCVCGIMMGQDVMTENDKKCLENSRVILRDLNVKKSNTEFLTIYLRSANQYSCKQFTNDFLTERFAKVLAPSKIDSPTAPQTAVPG